MIALVALVSGVLFGVGLIISGMIYPSKVLGFLDLAGAWDPSLMFVMAGAIPVAALGYKLVKARPHPLLSAEVNIPHSGRLDARLILGSALFGIGWGLAGICPGTSIVLAAGTIVTHNATSIVFVASMLIGMLVHDRWWTKRLPKQIGPLVTSPNNCIDC